MTALVVARRPAIDRRLAFAAVGVLGLGVQLAVLYTVTGWVGVDFRAGAALGVEAALLHNFVWHEGWTWADRVRPFRGQVFRRLARFHLANGVVSLAGNLALTSLFVGAFSMHYLPANLLAVGACVVLNFVAADRLVFWEECDDACGTERGVGGHVGDPGCAGPRGRAPGGATAAGDGGGLGHLRRRRRGPDRG